MIRRALVALAWAGGIIAGLVILLVAGALFVALVNATSGPAEPPDTGLTPEEIGDELSRPVLEEEARQRCQQAREEIPNLNC